MARPDELQLGASPSGYRSGFVSLVGRPNVGKSTLLNQVLRSKVAITSNRPQTTRFAIRGVHTTPEAQLVFVDTPGMHKPRTVLGERLNHVVRQTLEDVDVAVFVLDGADGVGGGDAFMAEVLASSSTPVIAVLNKVDLLDDAAVAAQTAKIRKLGEWTVLAVSARTGTGIGPLLDAVIERLPPGPLYYPPETVTDQPERQIVAELVREKTLERMNQEVPHSIAVVVDEIETNKDVVVIDATIYVERDSQKGIVIGTGGQVLKEIGTEARRDIEKVLGFRVFLRMRVKVERDWQRRAAMVERFGYGT